jgi:hypothetical protein
MHRRSLRITSIDDVWELADEWWRAEPIARRYYSAITETGERITIFRDLVNGSWYRQRDRDE